MNLRDAHGQSLVEIAAALPIVLVIGAGLYVACRTGNLASAAQSAAQAQALRAGRGMPGVEKQLAAVLLPGETGASVRSEAGRNARLLPSPFPSLAGRSSGVVSVDKAWREAGTVGGFPPLALVRRSDMTADCWDSNSRSGKKIRTTIRARIALGAIR